MDETFASFVEILGGVTLPYAYPHPPFWTDEIIDWNSQNRGKERRPNDWLTVIPGVCRGRLIGGNLNTMEGIFGTPYMPAIREGDILLLEDSLNDACTIERSFSMLKLAGVFDRIGGILLGKHELFDDNGTGCRPWEILLEVLDGISIPILAEFDCCHTHPMLTLPLGCRFELDAGAKRVTLLETPII